MLWVPRKSEVKPEVKVKPFMTEVPIIQKPVHWFALPVNFYMIRTPVMKEACNFSKKETPTQVLSCRIWEILRTPFFKEHLWWLLLTPRFAFCYWEICFLHPRFTILLVLIERKIRGHVLKKVQKKQVRPLSEIVWLIIMKIKRDCKIM